MPHLITARNVNDALIDATWWLHLAGVDEDSRNGRVRVAPGPVLTTYRAPLERVLTHPVRDANPFFHFMEALWMLAGRNEVRDVAHYVPRMLEYSDDGEVLHGAYGFRWRSWFGFDQLKVLIDLLRRDPTTRRAVLTMWSPLGDLVAAEGGAYSALDQPCNTQAYLDLRGDVLNMTVTCRSNDAVWGAYGANAVHFSFLLEYVAMHVGVPVGEYRQFSNNLHIYKSLKNYADFMPLHGHKDASLYEVGAIEPYPLISGNETPEDFDADLEKFFRHREKTHWRTTFFALVAAPLAEAWETRKAGAGTGRHEAAQIIASDWRAACLQWIDRRSPKKELAA